MTGQTNNSPPRLLLRFFRWYCHRDYLEDIEGDLFERFERSSEQKNPKYARWGFFKDVIRLFRPGIIRPLFSNQRFNQLGMFKNYFTIATRSLLKQKLYSTINIGGLTVGLTCFIVIFIYVQHELSYDNFYSNKDNIYRVYQRQVGNSYLGTDNFAVTPPELASALINEYSEVESATSIRERSALLVADSANFFEDGLWADDQFFNIFNQEFLKGNPSKVFNQPTAIVLTESLANKMFVDKSPIGQTISVSSFYGPQEFTVSGIIKDLPKNSSFQFSYITNIQSSSQYTDAVKSAKWNNNSCHTFLSLNKEASPTDLQQLLPDLLSKYAGENSRTENIYYLQPLRELHLQKKVNFDVGLKGNPQYVLLFSVIAIIVLLLACINYVNLAVARSIQRAKEVGLRKVIGAVRFQLIGQFLGESIFIALFALVLAIGFSYLLLPAFGAILERPLALDFVNNPLLIPMLSILVLLVGLFSGSYPAFFMSSLKPVDTLKGKINPHSPKMRFQSWLVIIQYATSIILIISSLVIFLQFDFIQNKELGYDKEHIIVVRTRSSELRKKIDEIKNELLAYASIKSMTTSNDLPSRISSSSDVKLKKEHSNDEGIPIYNTTVDYDYLNTFGLKLLAGRNFSPEIVSDIEDGVIINESAAKAFGWSAQEAIGQQFYRGGYQKILGVVKDFHMFSMHLEIQPLMLSLRKDYFNYISIKVQPDHLPNTIDLIEETIQKRSSYPFEFKFMNDEFNKLYKSDVRLGKIFGLFTILSILIASLGLFGLAAYTAKQKTKEIGIRKVLGASVQLIIGLIAKDFLRMVLLGFVIALPIAWFIMNTWLQDYAYRIQLEWWMFAIAGLLAAFISLITISSQSIKAAVANPVDSLRNE